MRTSILKSLKPDIIVEMLEMAVVFENWKKVMETADILYQCVLISMNIGSIIKR